MYRFLPLALAVGCGRFGFGEPPPDADAPDPSLTLSLSFEDDPSSGSVSDSTGHGFDGLCIAGVGGTCPTAASGRQGNAARFTSGQFLRIANTQSLDPASAFALAAWVYLDDASVDHVAVGREFGTGSSDSIALVSWAGSMTCFESVITGEVLEDVCTSYQLPVGEWHHITASWDGVMKSLWIDGVALNTKLGSNVLFDAHDLVVGCDENGGVPAFQWYGRIDELRFYSRALAPSEILDLSR